MHRKILFCAASFLFVAFDADSLIAKDIDSQIAKDVDSQIAKDVAEQPNESKVKIVKTFRGQRLHVGGPVINARGEVAFTIFNSSVDDENGVWFVPPNGDPIRIVRHDQRLPEQPDGTVANRTDQAVFLNDTGQLAFRSRLKVDRRQLDGIWIHDSTRGIKSAFISGMPAPGMAGQTLKDVSSIVGLSNGPNLKLVFKATVTNASTNSKRLSAAGRFGRDRKLWEKTWDGELELVVSDAIVIDHMEAMNAQGVLAFAMGERGSTQSIQLKARGLSIPIATAGDPVVIGSNTCAIQRIYGHTLNDQGAVAFTAVVDGLPKGRVAVLAHDAVGGVQPVLHADMEIEGYEGAEIENNTATLMNGAGNVLAFPTHSQNLPATMFYCAKGGKPKVLFADQRSAPGTDTIFATPQQPAGLNADLAAAASRKWRAGSRLDQSVPFTNVVFNERSLVAFVGVLGGNRSDVNDAGIWIADAERGGAQLVVRTGDKMESASHEKTVLSFLFASGGRSNNTSQAGLNDRGQLAYALQFDDGTSAIVVNNSHAVAQGEVAAEETPKVGTAEVAAARESLRKWESLADQQLVALNESKLVSDHFKLLALARNLKDEYQKQQSLLLELRSHRDDVDAIAQATRMNAVEKRIRDLPVLWKALGRWPFQKPKATTSLEDREFARQTQLTLAACEDFLDLQDKLQAKMKELENAKPQPLVFVERDRRERRARLPFFSTSREKLTIFDGPIGELQPGLLPDTNMIGDPKAKLPAGPILDVRKEFSRLVKLGITDDGKLFLDRKHWNVNEASYTDAQALRVVYDLLQEAKISEQVLLEEGIRRLGLQGLDRRLASGNHDSAGIAELFGQLQQAAGERAAPKRSESSSSGGFGENGRAMKFSLGGLMWGQLLTDSNFVDIQLVEFVGAQRTLGIKATEDGKLRIIVESEDDFFLLLQRTDGTIRWVTDPSANEERMHVADNFMELYREQPALVETSLIVYLNAFGFIGPEKRTDSEYLRAIVLQLRSLSPEVRNTVDESVVQLDSESFDERQRAFKFLAKDALLYRPALEKILAGESSLEVQSQVERLVLFAKEQSNSYGNLIRLFGVMESTEQLTELLEVASDDERAILDARLRELHEKNRQ